MTGRFVVELDLARGIARSTPNLAMRYGCGVVARGYVANLAELRDEARRAGFAPPLDDEALFGFAFRRWGSALQEHVLGEYAVAVFDESARRLLFANDALGLVPGFFSSTATALVAGSHLDDVVQAAGDRTIDEEYVADYLVLGRPTGARTPYRCARRLEVGRSVEWACDRVRERETWTITRTPTIHFASAADYEERARELLAEGVRAALRADGPVWCEVSGGLDSSTVASIAAASCGRALPALSMVYGRSASADETPWIRSVLERYDLPWHTVDVDAYPPFSELPEIAFPEPNAVMPVWPLHRAYAALVEQHGVEVVLTGHGGDLVFGGDSQQPHHLADPLLRLDVAGLARGVAEWQRRSPLQRSAVHLLHANVVRPAIRHCLGKTLRDDGTPSWDVPGWIDPAFARRMDVSRRQHRRYAARCSTVGQQYFWEGLVSTGSASGTARDQLAQSFAYRNPLLYRPLVEFFFAIPPQQRLEPDLDRSLQRRALAGILPERVRKRRGKRGAQEAYFEGLRRAHAWLDILRQRPLVVERGYVDERRWLETVEQARFGRANTMRHFLVTATLECWLRQIEAEPSDTLTQHQGEHDERQERVFQP